jgi:outer membrane cobalamin receptor
MRLTLRALLCVFTLIVLVSAHASAQSSGMVMGAVVDSSGAPVPDAAVVLESAGAAIAEFHTTADGRFTFSTDAAGPLQVRVTATGFAQALASITTDRQEVRVALQPAPFFEAVNVTSSRTDVPRADPTATVTVISSAELLTSGAITLDDALKAVPGFTLFRRTSSRVSNPTAQGITLRGLGGTGASRSLVLADGVPLNDAFGGWVYWDRVPQVAIDRVEVLRGSGSDLYGADAVGGVVQILTVRPSRRTVRALIEGGALGTGRVSLFGGGHNGAWTYTGGGEWFATDGYISVAEHQNPGIAPRGPIDTKAGSRHRSGLASVAYQMSSGWRLDARANVFRENRENGTPAVVNDTDARQGAGEISGSVGGGLLAVRMFGGTQDYDQTFSAVSADRRSEALNRIQRIPTRATGLGGQWIHPWRRHSLLLGAEGRFIKGRTVETPYAQGLPLVTTDAGGTQRVGSAFAQETFNATDRLTLVAGVHADGWHSESLTTTYNKTLGSLNPRASLAYRIATTGWSLRGSVYQGFRAPTLNELYRGFRAGNTDTRPNEALRPERLTGGEGGVLFARGRVSARVTGFWNVLNDTVTNITLAITPQLITKQRANADKVRATGMELEAEVQLPASLSVAFSSAIINSRFKGDTPLRDNRVPQVPTYNAAVNVRYGGHTWIASGQLRVTGAQFEDDLNLFTLRRATVLDVFGSRRFGGRLSTFVAVENLFDSEYDVGRTPILTTGLPRAARVGVQLWLP